MPPAGNQLVNQMNNMNLDQNQMPGGGMPDFSNQNNQPPEFQPSNPLEKFGKGNNDVFGSGPPNVFGNQPDDQPQMDVFQKPPPIKQEPPRPTGPINVDDMVVPAVGGGGPGNQMSEYPEGDERNTNASST